MMGVHLLTFCFDAEFRDLCQQSFDDCGIGIVGIEEDSQGVVAVVGDSCHDRGAFLA